MTMPTPGPTYGMKFRAVASTPQSHGLGIPRSINPAASVTPSPRHHLVEQARPVRRDLERVAALLGGDVGDPLDSLGEIRHAPEGAAEDRALLLQVAQHPRKAGRPLGRGRGELERAPASEC
jgi:hypothetical protein